MAFLADPDLVAKVSAPFVTVVGTFLLARYFSERPSLIVYVVHSSTFNVNNAPSNQPDAKVNAHSIVVRNQGRKAAHNVQIGHNVLPINYQVYPHVVHDVTKMSGEAGEIVIPVLVPQEQVTIAYLYWPPLVMPNIHSYFKSDEGLANVINVIPTRQWPKWLILLFWGLATIGATLVAYFLLKLLFILLG